MISFLSSSYYYIILFFTDTPVRFTSDPTNNDILTLDINNLTSNSVIRYISNNRDDIKNILFDHLNNQDIFSSPLQVRFRTDHQSYLSPHRIYTIRDIDDFIDDAITYLTNTFDPSHSNLLEFSIVISGAPFSFDVESVFNDTCHLMKLNVPQSYLKDLALYLSHHRQPIESNILDLMHQHNRYSDKFILESSFVMKRLIAGSDNEEKQVFHIVSESRQFSRHELGDLITHFIDTINDRFNLVDNVLEGSGWVIDHVQRCIIKICHFNRFGVGSHIPYPAGLRGQFSIFNPQTCSLIYEIFTLYSPACNLYSP